MKRRKHRREIEENEDTKSRNRNPNQREIEPDKLSVFPDCILLHILSFLETKQAVRTCLLSTRWKHLWKHLPKFKLSCSDHVFHSRRSFTNFECQCILKARLLKNIVTSLSHNVHSLRLSCPMENIPFPPSLISCQSLTSLDLGHPKSYMHVIFPNSLNFPVLAYLKLHFFSFCSGNDGKVEPFSTFNKLNTLILCDCRVHDAKPLCISSTTIRDLSIQDCCPQHCLNIVLFAPKLCTFAFTGNPFHKLNVSHLSSIKHITIDILFELDYSVENSLCLLDWLKEIAEITSLTMTPRTLLALSFIPDILKLKLPFLCNLKSLQLNLSWEPDRFFASSWRDIKRELAGGKSWKENPKLPETIKARLNPRNLSIMDGMIDFLLQNSPSAKVDIKPSRVYLMQY